MKPKQTARFLVEAFREEEETVRTTGEIEGEHDELLISLVALCVKDDRVLELLKQTVYVTEEMRQEHKEGGFDLSKHLQGGIKKKAD